MIGLLRLTVIVCAFFVCNATHAVDFTVNDTSDSVDANPGDGICLDNSGSCTLRAAVMESNALSGPDTITVSAGFYILTIAGADEDLAATGDLDLTDIVNINGAGNLDTVISGNSIDRVFHVSQAEAALMVNLAVIQGLVNEGGGGGIYNEGTLTLDGVILSGNSADNTQGGGGLWNTGTAEVLRSEFNFNNAIGANGGGILSTQGSLTVTDTIFDDNLADNGGGLAHSGIDLSVFRSTFFNNQASTSGGGVWMNGQGGANPDELNDISATLNSAQIGGGVYVEGRNVNFFEGFIESNESTFAGAGIYLGSEVTGAEINGTQIRFNIAGSDPGGGVYSNIDPVGISTRLLSMNDVLIDGNAGCGGGGIWNRSGRLEITDSTISNNQTAGSCDARWEGNGGGIGLLFFSTPVTTTNVAIHNNTAERGGGIYSGLQTLTNTTVSGNSANQGGGLYTSGGSGNPISIFLDNATIAENSATAAGGNLFSAGNESRIKNSIIADAPTGGNCFGTFTSQNFNIDSDGTCGFTGTDDQVADPLLQPLADNGGTTRTHALDPASRAVDAILSGCTAIADQRGESRPQDGDNNGSVLCDAGAYEVEGPAPKLVSLADINGNGAADFMVLIQNPMTGVYELAVKDSSTGGDIFQSDLPGVQSIEIGAVGALDLAAVPDVNGNGAQEMAVLTRDGAGAVVVNVYDALTGALVRAITYPAAFVPQFMTVIPDIDGTGAPAIAVLGIRDDGTVRATIKRAVNGALVTGVSFAPNFPPKFMETVPDVTGNGIAELAVLGIDAAGNIRVQLKDASTGTLIHWIQYARAFAPMAMVVVPDAPAGPAIGVLGVHNDGRVSAQVKDAFLRTNLTVGRINFSRTFAFEQMTVVGDLNGNGTSELVYLGVDATGTVRAQVKDTLTKALINQVFFSKTFPPDAIAAFDDINGNGNGELGVLGTNPNNGNVRVQIKDAETNDEIGAIFVP